MSDEFDPYFKWLGIPPKQQPPDHYRLLGVPEFTDDADVISHAVDRLMTHLRTFQSGPNSAHSQKLLNEISAARVCLLNAESKAAYDEQLRRELDAQRQPAEVSATVPHSSSTQPSPSSGPTPTAPAEPPEPTDFITAAPRIGSGGRGRPTIMRTKYPARKKKQSLVLPLLVCLIAVVVLSIILYQVVSQSGNGAGPDPILGGPTNGARSQGGQTSEIMPAVATAAQKKKLADIDQNADGKVIIAEYLAAQGRDFERRDKDKDDALSNTEYPGVELIDKNGDGKLDRQEYNARMEVKFDLMDMNKDGVLTADEM